MYAIIDENGHEGIDFKYTWLWDLYISKNEDIINLDGLYYLINMNERECLEEIYNSFYICEVCLKRVVSFKNEIFYSIYYGYYFYNVLVLLFGKNVVY